MSLIGKKIEDFKVQAYHNGKFVEVSNEDVLGKWANFLLLSSRLHICLPN